MTLTDPEILDVQPLRERMDGAVVVPADASWDDARRAWNLAVDQRPAAVALPVSEDDVVAVVEFARERGLRVAPQGTGHNAGAIASLEGAILLRTSEMKGVEIDAEARRARVRAGALWLEVTEPASEHGLAPLAGSSPDVGVVGYTLGGGIGFLARRYGMSANSVEAIELVTADGRRVRADRDNEPDLFWALRGGGGNLGVVTAMELRLYDVPELCAGWLLWPWEDSERVLSRWAEWAPGAPDEITTSLRILQLPPLPEIPEPLHGNWVAIDGAFLGTEEAAREVLAPLRELEPKMDTWAVTPPVGLSHLHADPPQPVPGASNSAMLSELPPEAIRAFVEAAGPQAGTALLAAELRQGGGALARAPEDAGVLATVDAQFALFAVGIVMGPEMGTKVAADARRLVEAMKPWSTGGSYLNFAEEPTDTRSAYAPEAYERLQAICRRFDPDGLFMANHPVPAAG